MRAMRRTIPYAVLFTQTKVVAKSKTNRHIASQFHVNDQIDTFKTEIVERDAFAALFALGGTVRTIKSKHVNNLASAIENIEAFTYEVVSKLRAQQTMSKAKEVA